MNKCRRSCNKKYGVQGNNRQIELDKKVRKKEEKEFGIKFTDSEWSDYKIRSIQSTCLHTKTYTEKNIEYCKNCWKALKIIT